MKGSRLAAGAICLALVLLLVASQLPAAESATCNLNQLLPCSRAYFSSVPPSAACCAKVREQQPCFCQYLRNPNLRNYVNSPNTRRIEAACRVSYPRFLTSLILLELPISISFGLHPIWLLGIALSSSCVIVGSFCPQGVRSCATSRLVLFTYELIPLLHLQE
ncbi:hypothetical protein Taro_055304 [Colocasia esculenta]|uniref:Bifunctional inhibitor/plant lipid transfer protein/seed storage helical domain-containing protein n=1 Tax=Colocasia esculenta TaxID=4460 RepID=A0A843XQY0_COLES|nr:hypothetical protein [Colocasia esculenta]